MTSIVCIDASLALKLVFHELDSKLARALWAEWHTQQVTLIAPILWGYEVTSVIRNRVHRGRLAPDMEREAFVTVHQLPVQLMQPVGLHQHAWQLARRFDRPAAYDAHYLALAEIADCPFWTADQRLFNVVRNEFDWVHWLGDYQEAKA
jgi:predicted nucleic acid-binding protein